MKIQFFLVTLFAIICFIEAHKIKVKFVSVFNQLDSTKGTATLTLKGEDSVKQIIFDKEFTHYNDFEVEDEFNEDIKSINVKWDTTSKKSLVLLYTMVYVDDSKELINFYMSELIENGQEKTYNKN